MVFVYSVAWCSTYGSSRRICRVRQVEPRGTIVRGGKLAEVPLSGSIGVRIRWKGIGIVSLVGGKVNGFVK